MDSNDFPSLQPNDMSADKPSNTTWADIAKESPDSTNQQPLTDNIDQKNDHGKTTTQLNKDAPGNRVKKKETMKPLLLTNAYVFFFLLSFDDGEEFVPNGLAKTYADATSHAGFPTLEESVSKQVPNRHDQSDVPPSAHSSANPSFAKVAAMKPPPSEPQLKELKKDDESPQPPSIDDQDAFPPIQSSSTGKNSEPDQSYAGYPTELSFVQVTSKDLDQAPPSAKSHVDTLPTFNENDIIAANARHETRTKAQSDDTPEQQEDEPRKYKHKFTLWNTIKVLRANGYSWLISLILAFLLHIRYSPCTSPFSFPLVYRSLTDMVTLPIYTKALHATLLRLPILAVSDQEYCRGLGLKDGFRLVRKHVRWWQFGLWTSHWIQWLIAYMVLHDPSSLRVPYPALLALKNESGGRSKQS
ncbi:hypothetical protein BC941DRAFT_433241 [Chlamydoabsidia padenii]|nr:hypothetical protein BC941DRAFT_433241 [Chlamydoabsidia padenii]